MKVLIAIQARSGSKRLPRKAFELISGRMMLDRVIETCNGASKNIIDKGNKCIVCVVTPTNDPIVEEFGNRVEIIQGPEHDVLERYRLAIDHYDPDYIVRITGDCPLIPSQHISHMTMLAIDRGYDYISNCDERVRTSLDGDDCEVISRRLFDTLVTCATRPYDREHVTPYIRRNPPEWAHIGMAMSHFDLSDVKLSVDTPEDLEKVRKSFASSYSKYKTAIGLFGTKAIHKI